MFEQGSMGRTRRAWTVAVGFAGQLVLLAGAMIAPLVMIDPPRIAELTAPFIAPPIQRGGERGDVVTLVAAPEGDKPHPFTEPAQVPQGVEQVVDAPPEMASGPRGTCAGGNCVPGLPNGVAGGMEPLAYERPIAPPPVVETRRAAPVEHAPATIRLRIGGNIQESRITHRVLPAYPPMARKLRISGIVVLNAVIGTDGRVWELRAMSGHPWLVAAAVEAVRQWTYLPALLNGDAVEVNTEITVKFSLTEK